MFDRGESRQFVSYQRLWPWQKEETAQIGYIYSCAAARGFDEVSGNHCISSILLSTEGERVEMDEGGEEEFIMSSKRQHKFKKP